MSKEYFPGPLSLPHKKNLPPLDSISFSPSRSFGHKELNARGGLARSIQRSEVVFKHSILPASGKNDRANNIPESLINRLSLDELNKASEDDMYNHALLTRREEIALAKQMKRRDNKNKKMGEEARRKLILYNMRLVRNIARKEGVNHNVLPSKLRTPGIIGLIRAVDKYKYRRGKLSTYATWWITHEIKLAIIDEHHIRIPMETYSRVKKASRMKYLQQTIDKQPMGKKKREKKLIKNKSQTRIESYVNLLYHPSLEAPMGQDGSLSLADLIPDPDLTDETADRNIKIQALNIALSELNVEQRRVLQYLYGIKPLSAGKLNRKFKGNNTNRAAVYEAVAKQIGVSGQTIRNIEKEALRILLEHPALKKLK